MEQTLPAAPAEPLTPTFSRFQTLIGLVVALLGLGTAIGAPVYNLFQSRDKHEARFEAQQKTLDWHTREVNLRRDENNTILKSLTKLEANQENTQKGVDDLKAMVKDLDRAQWRK